MEIRRWEKKWKLKRLKKERGGNGGQKGKKIKGQRWDASKIVR